MEANSNPASGMRACLRRNGTGSRCTGKERDGNGLDYFGARYYDGSGSNATFRWISADSLTSHIYDPPSLNKYAYCRGNPVTLVDPDGTNAASFLCVFYAIVEVSGPPDEPDIRIREFSRCTPNPWDGPGTGPSVQIKCFIQLKYRDVKNVPGPDFHSYLWVQDRNGVQHIIEGQPRLEWVPAGRGLGERFEWRAFLTSLHGPLGAFPDNHVGEDSAWVYDEYGDDTCDKVDVLLGEAAGFDKWVPYNAWYGPNCHSFTRFLLARVGLAPPSEVTGLLRSWATLIPGYETSPFRRGR
jgi:RHS repeat-associated protein